MNPSRQDASTPTKEDISLIRHAYPDLDQGGLEALASVENSKTVPCHNRIVSSQVHPAQFQIVWRVEETGLEEAEGLLHAMVREFGGDPAAADATRVLRLRGFASRPLDRLGDDPFLNVLR